MCTAPLPTLPHWWAFSANFPQEKQQAAAFVSDYTARGYTVYAVEEHLEFESTRNPGYVVAGRADLVLLRPDGRLCVVDFKRTGAAGPWKHESWGRQLNAYARGVEAQPHCVFGGGKVAELLVVTLFPGQESYGLYSALGADEAGGVGWGWMRDFY